MSDNHTSTVSNELWGRGVPIRRTTTPKKKDHTAEVN
jgi:hypothetical protein